MKKIYSRRSLILLLICGFFLSNCSRLINSLNEYSGETLYNSAVKSDDILSFAPDIQADVYQHLHTEKERRLFQEFQKDFIAMLINENPAFAKDFYNKMHSQDQAKIKQALTHAGELVEKELQEFTEKNEISAENVVKTVLKKYKDV